MVRRPASLLGGSGRAAAGAAAAYLGALAYYLVAGDIPALSDPDANYLVSTGLGLVVGALCVVATVPLRDHWELLIGTLALGAAGGLALSAADSLDAATSFKLLFGASAGFLLARALWAPALAYAVAALVFVVDIASVAAGPTKYLIQSQPRAVDFLTLSIPAWGGSGGGQLGVSDIIFLAVFLYVTWRFGLRRRATAAALVGSFLGSLLLAYWLDRAVPALPLMAIALVAPNPDIVVRQLRAGL